MLLGQAEERLKEAKQESERRNMEFGVQRKEMKRLQGELQKEEEKMRGIIGKNKGLSAHNRQLRRMLEELHSKYQVTGNKYQ